MAETHIVKAHIKGVDQSPRKVNLVASLVRGRSVADALIILEHTPRRAAKAVKKAIESAQANAINNHGLDVKSLQVDTLSVSTGPRYKRYRPVARGRALPIQHKSSHILVKLSGAEKPKKKPAAKTEAKATEVKAKPTPKASVDKKEVK